MGKRLALIDEATDSTSVIELATTAGERPGSWFGAWLAVAAAAIVPYLNTLGGGFVYDDHGLVVTNPMATPGMVAWEWFLRPSIPGSVYRPVTMLSYAFDAALG